MFELFKYTKLWQRLEKQGRLNLLFVWKLMAFELNTFLEVSHFVADCTWNGNFCMSRKADGEDRTAVVRAPKYQFGVLEGGWQYRRKDDVLPQPQPPKRQPLPPFKACSIYKTSYRSPPADSYGRDLTSWQIRGKSEGLSRDLLEGDEKECRENFTTTTDLVYRILPQLCPKLREYNSNALEWFPPQNFLSCYGNLTQHGLKKQKELEWTTDLRLMTGPPATGITTVTTPNGLSTTLASTTYWDHYREPPPNYLVTNRKAISRPFSSSLDLNNVTMANQTFRGKTPLQVPIVDPSIFPIPECRFPLSILPTLPEDPPYRIERPLDGGNGVSVKAC